MTKQLYMFKNLFIHTFSPEILRISMFEMVFVVGMALTSAYIMWFAMLKDIFHSMWNFGLGRKNQIRIIFWVGTDLLLPKQFLATANHKKTTVFLYSTYEKTVFHQIMLAPHRVYSTFVVFLATANHRETTVFLYSTSKKTLYLYSMFHQIMLASHRVYLTFVVD